jgi:hypothetical protein
MALIHRTLCKRSRKPRSSWGSMAAETEHLRIAQSRWVTAGDDGIGDRSPLLAAEKDRLRRYKVVVAPAAHLARTQPAVTTCTNSVQVAWVKPCRWTKSVQPSWVGLGGPGLGSGSGWMRVSPTQGWPNNTATTCRAREQASGPSRVGHANAD